MSLSANNNEITLHCYMLIMWRTLMLVIRLCIHVITETVFTVMCCAHQCLK